MAEQSKPRISNITKFFVPGLVIGLAVGGLGGAYYSSRLEMPTMQEVKHSGPAPTKHVTGRPEDQPETPAAPAATGATGVSGTTGTTGATGETGSTAAPK